MRLKREVLKTRCKGPLNSAKYINLSGLELGKLEKLNACENLRWLFAQDNKLVGDEGLEKLSQLWYLDLSNNHICYVDYLDRYLALGTLILSNNNLKWQDLGRLQHGHFLSISLHGNPCLDADPYYRIHVIDCLPLIWELDGRLVTVTERLHVKQFFIDTEYTQHPVRRKLSKKSFKTTAIRNIGTQGIVSQMCKYIYSKFPMSETHTKHTDERRLKYLTHMVQEDILKCALELPSNDPGKPKSLDENFLDDLLECRKKDVEGCNMVLLLLVISLEFQLPTSLVVAVLNAAKLSKIGSVSTMPIFLLPRAFRTKVIQVLINAAKVDRDNNVQHEGGLYPQLFMCLYHTVALLTHISQTSEANMKNVKPLSHDSDYMALMASEVVSLMVQVPKYLHYLATEPGVINLTASATGSVQAVIAVQDILMDNSPREDSTRRQTNEAMAKKMILEAVSSRLDRVNIKMADIPVGDRYLALSDSLPIKPLHSVIWTSNFLTKGETIPCLEPPILNPAREAAKPKPIPPKRGENVLLGPQVVGEISMLLQGDIGLVKIDNVPVSSGAVESKLRSSDAHFTFVDMKALCYARDIGMWRPTKTTGDKYTIQSTDEFDHRVGSAKDSQPEPLIYTPRTRTAVTYANGAKRPQTAAVPDHNRISQSMTRRVLSAGNNGGNQSLHNNSLANMGQELEELFPQVEEDEEMVAVGPSIMMPAAEAANHSRVSSATAAPAQPAINTELLHKHDDVVHIRGLTPREDTARSYTLSQATTLTPTTAETFGSRSATSSALATVVSPDT